jgi:hypothetical protein
VTSASACAEHLADAGQEIANAAAARAPRKTGQLAGSIRARLNENGTRMTETVAPAGRYGSFVGMLMEFGVVNHGTRGNVATAGGGLKSKGGKRARARRVSELRGAGQYRIRPRPFMEPAYDSLRARVQADIDAAVQKATAEANR